MNWKIVSSLALSSNLAMFALNANANLTVDDGESENVIQREQPFSPTYTGVTATAYSARCRYDSTGGRDETALGGRAVKPRSHAFDIEHPENSSKIVVAAVSQLGGLSGLKGCYVKIHIGKGSDVPSKLKQQIEKTWIAIADVYGAGSNNKMKMDISYQCSSQLRHYTIKNISLSRQFCPKRKDFVASIDQMTRKIASEEAQTQQADASPAPPVRSAFNGIDFSGTPVAR